MKTLIESINTLNKNISEAATEKETVLEGLQEFIDVINEDAETTIESITDAAEKIAEILPDKIGGGDTPVNESYDISEGKLNTATVTLEGDVVAHIPDGVVTIGNKAFMDNEVINKVVMSDSVTAIEDGNFQFPGSSDNAAAFGGCINLKEIIWSNNLTSIGIMAFQNCSSLALTTLPDSLTSIGNQAFYSCTNLALTALPDSLTSIGTQAFYGCTNLALTALPDSLTSIGGYTFQNCSSLALTTLPDSLTSIGNQAFQNCSSLALTTLPDSLTSIGNQAFYGCTNLALTALPDSLTSIGGYAFQYCTRLAVVDLTSFDATSEGFNIPQLGSSAFNSNASGRKFYFKNQTTLNAFASATNWNVYANDFTTDPVPSV